MSVRGYAAWLAATAVVLVGCSEEDAGEGAGPTSGPSSSSGSESGSASGSPSAEPTPAPSLPAEAQVNSEAGAEAFARHYVDLMNHAQATGDAEALAAAASPDCAVCGGYVQAAEEGYSDGGWIEGGDFVVRETSPLPADYGADYGVYAVIDVAEQTVVRADGTAEVYDPLEYRIGLYPTWMGEGWVMTWIAVPE